MLMKTNEDEIEPDDGIEGAEDIGILMINAGTDQIRTNFPGKAYAEQVMYQAMIDNLIMRLKTMGWREHQLKGYLTGSVDDAIEFLADCDEKEGRCV